MVGVAEVKGGIMLVIGFMLVVVLGAAMLPDAISDWFNASTGDWGTLAATLWPLVPGFIVLGVGLYAVAAAFDVF